MRALAGALAALAVAASAPALACVGDCNRDVSVTVDEVVFGVNIALGSAQLDACPAFDADGNDAVTVDELITAIGFALTGCPAASPTSTSSPLPTRTLTETPGPSVTATPTLEPTATPTPTSTINLAPFAPSPFVYRGSTGELISLPVGGTDPEGAPLTYEARDLPAGAVLEPDSGVLTWTPEPGQYGAFYVPYVVRDPAGAAGEGRLVFDIEPYNQCAQPMCAEATGCTFETTSVSARCCTEEETPRVWPPEAGCPEGRTMLIGRNSATGFGLLQDCDQLRVFNMAQTGAKISLNVAARCINTANQVKLRVRLEMDRPVGGPTVLIDNEARFPMTVEPDGYAMRRSVQYAVGDGVTPPFYDFEDAEANFYFELRDAEAHLLTQSVRVRLTFTPIPDLVDPTPVATPTPLPTTVAEGQ